MLQSKVVFFCLSFATATTEGALGGSSHWCFRHIHFCPAERFVFDARDLATAACLSCVHSLRVCLFVCVLPQAVRIAVSVGLQYCFRVKSCFVRRFYVTGGNLCEHTKKAELLLMSVPVWLPGYWSLDPPCPCLGSPTRVRPTLLGPWRRTWPSSSNMTRRQTR